MFIIVVVPVVPYVWQSYLILAITVTIIITSWFSNWDCNCCCNQFFNNPMLIQRSEIQGCWQWSPSWRRSGAIPSEETWSTTENVVHPIPSCGESSFSPWRSPWVGDRPHKIRLTQKWPSRSFIPRMGIQSYDTRALILHESFRQLVGFAISQWKIVVQRYI